MRDLAENLGILVSHRPYRLAAGTYNTRANGAHNTAGEIDLADYNYPRKILVVVTVGIADQLQIPPWTQATLDIKIKSGNASGALTNTDKTFTQMVGAGEQIYEYETVRRFINIECIITNVISLYVTWAVVLVTDHARYGNMGSDD
jgi:hypothetical protein